MNNYNTLIQEIKDKSDIVSVISEYVSLEKKGSSFVGCCPFHNEKSPSFSVSTNLEIYKCFGCGESGDVINFVTNYEKVSVHEAVLKLSNKFKVDTSEFLSKRTAEQIEKDTATYKLQQSILIANEAAKELFKSQLSETHFEYFKSRGLEKETIEKFEIGYNPKNSKIEKLIKFDKEILLKASLLGEKDNRIYNFFYDERLMFPIADKYGKCIGFAGRTLNKEVKPKYLNSRASDVFDKSKTLYGFDLAKRKIASENLVYLVEGYTDVMMLNQLKIENSVAKLGTAFTESQAEILAKVSKRICFIPDSDIFDNKQKFQTLETEIKIALDANLYAEIVRIEKGDVCEIGNEIVALIEQKEDAIEFLSNHYFNIDKSPFGQKIALEKSAELIAKTDEKSQFIYIEKIADLYKIGKRILQKEVDNFKANSISDDEIKSDDYEDLSHIKVVDSFYELSLTTTPGGAVNEVYISRKRSELQAEYGPIYVQNIPRFNGLRVEPNHDDFEYVITKFHKSKRTANKTKKYKFVNWYNPLPYDLIEFDWKDEEKVQEKIGVTLSFLKHIFKEKHFLFGLDYLTIMYQFPLQKLPALGFVSRKKATGKSTFLDWTKEFYGANATMSSVDRISKNFNKLLEGKIMIAMEETKDENGTIENTLKDMITNELAIIEGKGKDSFEVSNFVKVMFASNYETNCLKILDNEDRFAVFKVDTIAKVDNKMKSKLIAEIPYFRHYLRNRTIQHKNEKRLWFKLEDYETKALKAIKERSVSPTIVLISELIRAIFLNTNLREFKLSSKHLSDYMNAYHKSKSFTMNWITGSLKDHNIFSSKNATNFKYPQLRIVFDDWDFEMKSQKARYFIFKVEDYLSMEELKLIETDENETEVSADEIAKMKAKIDELPDKDLPF